MKKNIILILVYFAVAVSNSSNAYFYADTNSVVPVAYYAQDSLPKPTGHVNPISTLSVVSALLAPIMLVIGFSGRELGFDPLSLGAILFILAIVGGIIGLVVRKDLMKGKYANYPEPKKLPLGQGRSWIGIFGTVFLTILIGAVVSCG